VDFKPGDVVIVRSGGVPMTVSKIEGDEVHCQWLDAKQKAQKGSFDSAVLKPFTRSGPMKPVFR
jgi:uncharacterized protein YodC (DUF2158 family)